MHHTSFMSTDRLKDGLSYGLSDVIQILTLEDSSPYQVPGAPSVELSFLGICQTKIMVAVCGGELGGVRECTPPKQSPFLPQAQWQCLCTLVATW